MYNLKKNVIKIRAKKKLCYEGSTPLNPPVHGELHPQAPHYFGMISPSQLVIGYHWFAFLTQVC